MTDPQATAIIAQLGLRPHPEGGWYRELWRAAAAPAERPPASSIYFLLEQDQRSHWHRVDAAELWLWHAGAPVTLLIAPDARGPVRAERLGGDVLGDERPQALVPPLHWQAATPGNGWALVSCIVAPAFDFAGFELAPPGWEPG